MGRNFLDVYNHNILDSRVLRRLLERLGLNREDSKDLLVYSDATYKQDIYVGGVLKGQVSSDILVEQAQDFKVNKDLVVQDDATVKGTLAVQQAIVFGDDSILMNSKNRAIAGKYYLNSNQLAANSGGSFIYTYLAVTGSHTSPAYVLGADIQAHFEPLDTKSTISHVYGIRSLVGEDSNLPFTYIGNLKGITSYVSLTGDDATIHTQVSLDTEFYVSAADIRVTGEAIGLRIIDMPVYDKGAKKWAIWTGVDPLRIGGDTTIKQDILVENDIKVVDQRVGGLGSSSGITMDFTSGIHKIEVVKGIIVNVKDLVS